jgi:predicted SAM-dependent methyltransferase
VNTSADRTKPALVNLGCGARYHPDWINIDIAADSPAVIAHDLSRGIPLGDASCDAVYHSNILEHFRRADARAFICECFRVLKPGGILRVATPDLERLCRLYLEKLEAASAGDPVAAHDYDWLMLELYDQTVREKSGGQMLEFLHQHPLPNEAFVLGRIGEEGRKILAGAPAPRSRSLGREILRRPRTVFDLLGTGVLKFFFGGDASRALGIGRFRLAGEVHHWMYDRFSLKRLLVSVGFAGPTLRPSDESAIADWNRFHLDTLENGRTIKPDSFFMEAVKP